MLCAEIYLEPAQVLSGKIRAKNSIDKRTGLGPPPIDYPGFHGGGGAAIAYAPLTMGAMGSCGGGFGPTLLYFFFLFFFSSSHSSLTFSFLH